MFVRSMRFFAAMLLKKCSFFSGPGTLIEK